MSGGDSGPEIGDSLFLPGAHRRHWDHPWLQGWFPGSSRGRQILRLKGKDAKNQA